MESNKPTLAVVSTWKIKCGIAGFAHKMVPAFEKKFKVDVFPLQQSILKANEKKLIKMGDKIIADMAKELSKYDYVNIQLEPGILGNRPKDIFARLQTLIKASKRPLITFHTVRQGTEFTKLGFTRRIVSRKPLTGLEFYNQSKFDRSYIELYKKINAGKLGKHVTCLFHTKSAEGYVKLRYPNIKTLNFPLTFIDAEEKAKYANSVEDDRQWLVNKFGLKPEQKIVSSYGFISKYKGYETAIKAAYECEEDVMLIIFGSIHPNSIQKFKPQDAYLSDLMGVVDRRNKGIPDIVNELMSSEGQVSMDFKGLTKAYKNGKKATNRVIFAGSLNDNDFERAINGSDVNIFSYQEVGQTSSGPIALSLDLQKKTIATYTKCFNQLERYAPECYDQFDIGNHLQLRKLIELNLAGIHTTSGQQAYSDTYSIENRVNLMYEAWKA